MEGKIWFESEYHVGTTFYVEIPQKVKDETPLKMLLNKQEETKTSND